MRRFFSPDKEKCEAFLRAKKNVLEQNRTKGVSPAAVLRKPSRRKAAKRIQTCYVQVLLLFIFLLFLIHLCFYHH
jgi:hypothetical protein